MSKKTKITNEFKKMVLSKAKIKENKKRENGADNIKLGDMGAWMELPGDVAWFIPELNMWVNGTCGGHCQGCFDHDNPRKSCCYVLKAIYQHTKRNEDGTVGDIIMNECTVKKGQAYRTLAMIHFRDELLISLDLQLTRKKKKFPIIRINESGELTCYEDLAMWCELARRHPETIFYLYTKNYKAVEKAIENNIITNNMFINISIWHENGIDAYLKFKNHSQIRAFVLVDNEWTKEVYKAHGLEITSMCGAYNENGKMNHNVTCSNCKKCFSNNGKCCGCYEH